MTCHGFSAYPNTKENQIRCDRQRGRNGFEKILKFLIVILCPFTHFSPSTTYPALGQPNPQYQPNNGLI